MASGAIYLLVLNGDPETAAKVVQAQFPDAAIVLVNKRQLREQSALQQINSLRRMQGKAFVVFAQDRDQIQDEQAFFWAGWLPRCEVTAFAFADGTVLLYSGWDYVAALGQLLRSLWNDTRILLRAYWLLRSMDTTAGTSDKMSNRPLAYLFPFLSDNVTVGGAMSHVGGVLQGLVRCGLPVKAFSGKALSSSVVETVLVRPRSGSHLFREAKLLSFNFDFIEQVEPLLREMRPVAIYQRHGRYTFSGVVLARRLKIPLILEFNGSEVWVSQHWDPSRFPGLLARCEDVSLVHAAEVVVVSEVLKADLTRRGFCPDRIHVNPNGVDPARFSPRCGGDLLRKRLGIKDGEVVAGFIGTFSYWHGVDVLKQAMVRLLSEQGDDRLRFLLIGDGPLRAEVRAELSAYESSGKVIFPGLVPHDEVPQHLDACDILLSPHIPLRDGEPFFGSPTKLFEYMAMEKAIVASRLEQLSTVLNDGKSALLVEPADPAALAAAILRLVKDPGLRRRLGEQARKDAVANFTWERNAARVVSLIRGEEPASGSLACAGIPLSEPRGQHD